MPNTCNCILCRTARHEAEKRENERALKELNQALSELAEVLSAIAPVETIELVVTPVNMSIVVTFREPTPQEVDEAWTKENKGRKFTILKDNQSRDNSYIGNVFEVVRLEGPMLIGRRLCTDGGYPPINGFKNIAIDTERYDTMPVTDAYYEALQR